MKIKTRIKITSNMFELLNLVNNVKASNIKDSYLKSFDRLIDPLFICVFYGLFKTKVIPPYDIEEINLEKNWDFSVDIGDYVNILNHYLLCLWFYHHKIPTENEAMNDYRKRLYDFLKKLLDESGHYYTDVLIPFYIQKADETKSDTMSYIYRMWNSDSVKLDPSKMSPEYLSMEFEDAKKEFIDEIILSTYNEIIKPA